MFAGCSEISRAIVKHVNIHARYLYVYQITLQGICWYNTLSDKKLMAWSYRMCLYYQISCSKSEILIQLINFNVIWITSYNPAETQPT